MPDSAPTSPIPSPPRISQSKETGRRCRAHIPAALPRWSVSSAAKIAAKSFRPGMELGASTLDVVSTACSQLVVSCASVALATGSAGSTATLATTEHAVGSLLRRPRAPDGMLLPNRTLLRRGQRQARDMATQCSGAAALQPEVTARLVDAARGALVATHLRSCDGCDDQAIAYLGAIADFMCSELLTAAVGQAEQECSGHVLPCHLNAALMADRELVEAWPCCFGHLEVTQMPIPFCCARFGLYDRSIRDCPMVVFGDDEQLDECVFGAVAVVRLSENPACSVASRAEEAQRVGAIALVLICSDDMLFEPTCRAGESDDLTIPVAVVAHIDQSLFDDDRTISLSLNEHGLAMYGKRTKLVPARDTPEDLRPLRAASTPESTTAALPSLSISPDIPDDKPEISRRQAKRAAFLPVSMDKRGDTEPSEPAVDLLGVVARLYPNGKRAKKSAFGELGDGFSLPSLVPKPMPTCRTYT